MAKSLQKNKTNNGILFFVKYPEIGNVKNRLSKGINDCLAVDLYTCFVKDTLALLNSLDSQILICYYPKRKKIKFMEWLGANYRYLSQDGSNLGERMKHCFIEAFNKGFDQLVVIGSDSPDIPGYFIIDAFNKLDDLNVVIGPSKDGGYYLLGFSKLSFIPSVFDGIRWSTSSVYKKTIDNLKNQSRKILKLPVWNDIDTLEDLIDFYQRNKNSSLKTSKTMNMIKNNIHIIQQHS